MPSEHPVHQDQHPWRKLVVQELVIEKQLVEQLLVEQLLLAEKASVQKREKEELLQHEKGVLLKRSMKVRGLPVLPQQELMTLTVTLKRKKELWKQMVLWKLRRQQPSKRRRLEGELEMRAHPSSFQVH